MTSPEVHEEELKRRKEHEEAIHLLQKAVDDIKIALEKLTTSDNLEKSLDHGESL